MKAFASRKGGAGCGDNPRHKYTCIGPFVQPRVTCCDLGWGNLVKTYPYMPVLVGDLLRTIQGFDALELGAFWALALAAWASPDLALPDDDKRLARFARCSPRQWLKIRSAVLGQWVLSEGRWRQDLVQIWNQNATAKSVQAVQAAQAKWLKHNKSPYAGALPEQSGSNANQKQNYKDHESDLPTSTDPARGSARNGGSAPRAMSAVLEGLAAKKRMKFMKGQ